MKGVYPYEYMHKSEKFHETSLPEKEEFCKDFEIKNLDENRDLYLQNETLLLPDFFGNFRKICLKIYHLDSTKFLSAPGLAWQTALKRLK